MFQMHRLALFLNTLDQKFYKHISNLLFYDREQNKGIKVGFKISNNKKVRINKSSGKEI